MTVAEALTAIRANTGHDSDTQFTDTQLTATLDRKLHQLRRKLVEAVPSLYESVTTPTIAAGASTITKPTNTIKLRLLERTDGGEYIPVCAEDGLWRSNPWGLSVYEQGSTFVIRPEADAPGSYRLTVVLGVSTIIGASTATVLDVPTGCEDILVEECSAWARQRHNEDPSYHLAQARRIWDEQRSALRKRYGVHGVGGLEVVRGWL